MASLNDKNYYQKNLKEVKDGRAWLTARLNNLGIKTTNSQANFVTAHLGQNAGELYTALLENGFITRQMTVYKAPEYLRFSVGTADENQRLIAEIEARKTLWDVAV
jgi:histidinol-phosphate aminotransferase